MDLTDFAGDKPITEDTYAPLPKGWYPTEIEKVTTKTSAKGDKYLALQFTVIGDRFANRKLFVNLNLWHPKDNVRRIAREQLQRLTGACGLAKIPTDAGEFVGHRPELRVETHDRKTGQEYTNQLGEPSNEVRGFRPPKGGASAEPGGRADEVDDDDLAF
jgi:hypothetical protein